MFSKLAVKLAKTLLDGASLSIEQRTELTNALVDKLIALPLHDILTTDEKGTLLLRGKRLDPGQAKLIRESASRMKQETARKIVEKQIKYLAITIGVHQGDSAEKVYFSKVALWVMQEMDKLYTLLAGPEEIDSEL